VRRADFRLDNPARPPLACVAASPAKPAPVEDSKAILQRAGRLADEGSLDDAALLCRQLVAGPMPCVEAYCLLGLIEEARGNKPQAEDCYNRALYLNPEHYESLIHLLLLVESRGDHARADTLRARAGRIRDKESTHAG